MCSWAGREGAEAPVHAYALAWPLWLKPRRPIYYFFGTEPTPVGAMGRLASGPVWGPPSVGVSAHLLSPGGGPPREGAIPVHPCCPPGCLPQ
eukprot:7405075-Alexandrium_andersonii.AAC.1